MSNFEPEVPSPVLKKQGASGGSIERVPRETARKSLTETSRKGSGGSLMRTSIGSSSDESSSEDAGPMSFEGTFERFSKFGEKDREDHTISLKNIDKWLAQSGIKVTSADTAICFSKVARLEKRLSLPGLEVFLADLAKQKNMELSEMKEQMVSAGPPRFSTSKASIGGVAAAVTDRLTDVSNFTGTHRERVDEHGTAVSEFVSDDGYVQGYSNKDTYDVIH